MGVMNRKLLVFGFLTAMFIAVPVNAAVTVEQTTEPEYVINSGYSEAFAEDIFVSKNRALGKTIEPLYPKTATKFAKFRRAVRGYVDPANDTYDRIHHNIQLSPSWTDL